MYVEYLINDTGLSASIFVFEFEIIVLVVEPPTSDTTEAESMFTAFEIFTLGNIFEIFASKIVVAPVGTV